LKYERVFTRCPFIFTFWGTFEEALFFKLLKSNDLSIRWVWHQNCDKQC
jgi:hypothetical protein